MNILIFSRPIRSGKTTELATWCSGRAGVQGVLMPDRAGKRFFRDLVSGNEWLAEASDDEKALAAGRFLFSEAAFRKTCKHVALGMGAHWLIIDEIGRLELRGEGFADILRNILEEPGWAPQNLLLVVRDSLLADVIRTFELQRARVIHDMSDF
ncbi:MAG: hypothetical protein EOO15_00085 [Chitinophagaceae bacterium]|nr:MAG: hypothetical protein EOO15_00085 [Chitinophagaceae bacterium]